MTTNHNHYINHNIVEYIIVTIESNNDNNDNLMSFSKAGVRDEPELQRLAAGRVIIMIILIIIIIIIISSIILLLLIMMIMIIGLIYNNTC